MTLRDSHNWSNSVRVFHFKKHQCTLARLSPTQAWQSPSKASKSDGGDLQRVVAAEQLGVVVLVYSEMIPVVAMICHSVVTAIQQRPFVFVSVYSLQNSLQNTGHGSSLAVHLCRRTTSLAIMRAPGMLLAALLFFVTTSVHAANPTASQIFTLVGCDSVNFDYLLE